MFYAFSRLNRPQDFLATRTKVLTWATAEARSLFLQAETGSSFEKRRLTEDEAARIGTLTDDAWQGSGFGGYSTANERETVTGICHFRLDEARWQAELILLVLPRTESEEPSLADTLRLALTDLLRENPYLEKVYLPFQTGPATPTQITAMSDLELAPAERPGLWRVVYQEAEEESGATSNLPGEISAGDEPADPQTWLELSVRAEPEAVEAITELFARYGYNGGVVIEEEIQPGPDGGAVVDPLALVMVRTYITRADGAANLPKLREGLFYLGKLRHIEELQVAERHEEDWANAWKEFYQVHRVGRRTVIKPPWQEYTPLPDDIVVEIDPGMAFGTGLHPTTRLCLQLLEDRLDPAQHAKILDLGTGSGILAIAAARLGAPYVLGLDTDEVAIRSARENVARNGLSGQIQMETGSLAVESVEGKTGGFYSFSQEAQKPPAALTQNLPFDFLIANIIARILIALAEPMAQVLRPGGLLITSGIIEERANEVAQALEAAGLALVERRDENDWVAFAHTRP